MNMGAIFNSFTCLHPAEASARRWRKGRDSNSRYLLSTTVFKTVALNHSATLPEEPCNSLYRLTETF